MRVPTCLLFATAATFDASAAVADFLVGELCRGLYGGIMRNQEKER